MMRALWTASSGMTAQQMNVDVISNNLANVNTTGYKKSRLEFKDLFYETINKPTVAQEGSSTPVGLQVGHGVKYQDTYKIFTQGNTDQTGNPYDLFINGNGFFEVKVGEGTKYTKDGSLKLVTSDDGANNMLTTSTGDPVLNTDGESILIPVGIKDKDVSVGKDGTISYLDSSNTMQVVGKINIVDFSNTAGLQNDGDNYYSVTTASGQPIKESESETGQKSVVQQGFLESSNVQVVEEMVKLITAQRAYEVNSKSITTADEMLSQANNLKR